MIDRPDLIDDQYYLAPENFTGNPERKAEVDALVIEWCVQHTKREVMEKAQSVGYICGVLNQMDEVFADPHLEYRQYFTEIDHPHTGPLKYPGAQFRMAKLRHAWPPRFSANTGRRLEQAGYAAEDIAKLRKEGAVHTTIYRRRHPRHRHDGRLGRRSVPRCSATWAPRSSVSSPPSAGTRSFAWLATLR